MSIGLLHTLIDKKNFEDFKIAFKATPLNFHHKSLLLEKSFILKEVEFITYINNQISPSKELMVKVFMDNLKTPVDKKYLKFFEKLTDMDIVASFDYSVIEPMIKNQTTETLNALLEQFPLTVFKSIKSIAYNCIKYNKYDFIEPLLKEKLDTDTCFNICLCCFEADRPELVNKFLKAQIPVNPHVINELKNNQQKVFQNYLAKEAKRKQNAAALVAIMAAMAAAQAIKDAKKNKTTISTPVITSPTTPVATVKTKKSKEEYLNNFFQDNLTKALQDYLSENLKEKNDKPAKKTKI